MKGLDPLHVSYNTERPNYGRGMKGRTSAEVFLHCLPKPGTPREEKTKKAVGTRHPPEQATVMQIPYLYIIFLGIRKWPAFLGLKGRVDSQQRRIR